MKAKNRTIVTKKHLLEEEEEIDIFSSNHISVKEDERKSQSKDVQEAPTSFEEGNQATINELKQVNLGIEEKPHPIFINSFSKRDLK